MNPDYGDLVLAADARHGSRNRIAAAVFVGLYVHDTFYATLVDEFTTILTRGHGDI